MKATSLSVPDSQRFLETYGYKWADSKTSHYTKMAKCLNEPCDRILFYYTTVNTFQKFAEGGCIWASHIKYMNDWQEFELGKALVLDVLDQYSGSKRSPRGEMAAKFIKSAALVGREAERSGNLLKPFGYWLDYVDYWFPEVYSISFTAAEDLLSQWKMYARECGVAIGFDFRRKVSFWQGTIEEPSGKQTYGFAQNSCFPQKVAYNKQMLSKELRKTVTGIQRNYDSRTYHMISLLERIPFIKHDGFSQEDEYRMVFRPYKSWKDDHTILRSDVGYREADHTLIPYLRIFCGNEVDAKDPKYQIGWPVTSLTVGPGHNQDVVFRSLIHFVESGKCKLLRLSKEEKANALSLFLKSFSNWLAIYSVKEESKKLIKQVDALTPFGKMPLDRDRVMNQLRKNEKLYSLYCAYCEDNYLSRGGIHIKKSKIPYIFS